MPTHNFYKKEEAMNNMWVRVNNRTKIDLPFDTEVEVKYKNGKIVSARINGNWLVINPKDLGADELLCGIESYRIIK